MPLRKPANVLTSVSLKFKLNDSKTRLKRLSVFMAVQRLSAFLNFEEVCNSYKTFVKFWKVQDIERFCKELSHLVTLILECLKDH